MFFNKIWFWFCTIPLFIGAFLSWHLNNPELFKTTLFAILVAGACLGCGYVLFNEEDKE